MDKWIDEELVIKKDRIESLYNFHTAPHKISKNFFLRTNLAWHLSCSLKWLNTFSDGMWKLHSSKRGFSRYSEVQNPRYGWLQYPGYGRQKNKKKKKINTDNGTTLCVSYKCKKQNVLNRTPTWIWLTAFFIIYLPC